MYRVGQGALDQQIAVTVAAVRHGEHLTEVDQHLASEGARLRHRIGDIQAADATRAHGRLSLGRLWSLLRGTRADEQLAESIERADLDIMAAAFEHELALVDARRAAIAAELATVAGAAAHLIKLLEQKEAWLAATDAPGGAELLEIARVRGDWHALEECADAAFAVAAEAQSQLLQAIVYYEDAHDPASRYRGNDSYSGSKEGQLQQASVHAAMADVHVRTLDVELRAVAGASRRLGVRVVPELAASPNSGPSTAPSFEVSVDELRRDADRVSVVMVAIPPLRRAIAKQLAELNRLRLRLLER